MINKDTKGNLLVGFVKKLFIPKPPAIEAINDDAAELQPLVVNKHENEAKNNDSKA